MSESTTTNLRVRFWPFPDYGILESCEQWRWKANTVSWKVWKSDVSLLFIQWPKEVANWRIRSWIWNHKNQDLELLSLFYGVVRRIWFLWKSQELEVDSHKRHHCSVQKVRVYTVEKLTIFNGGFDLLYSGVGWIYMVNTPIPKSV